MAESQPLLTSDPSIVELDSPLVVPSTLGGPGEAAFRGIVHEVLLAIDSQIYPKRIVQGSSGSYFCLDATGVRLSVTIC